VIAAGGVRAVLEAVGVRNILTKSQGSNNLLNVTMATIDALEQLRAPEVLADMRGVPVQQVRPVWQRRGGGED
jgi:small subunit ribosomal protein S5